MCGPVNGVGGLSRLFDEVGRTTAMMDNVPADREEAETQQVLTSPWEPKLSAVDWVDGEVDSVTQTGQKKLCELQARCERGHPPKQKDLSTSVKEVVPEIAEWLTHKYRMHFDDDCLGWLVKNLDIHVKHSIGDRPDGLGWRWLKKNGEAVWSQTVPPPERTLKLVRIMLNSETGDLDKMTGRLTQIAWSLAVWGNGKLAKEVCDRFKLPNMSWPTLESVDPKFEDSRNRIIAQIAAAAMYYKTEDEIPLCREVLGLSSEAPTPMEDASSSN